jgi:hypothetical protein
VAGDVGDAVGTADADTDGAADADGTSVATADGEARVGSVPSVGSGVAAVD